MLPLLILLLIVSALLLFGRQRRSTALRTAAQELAQIRSGRGGRLRLSHPDPALEALLSQINGLLDDRSRETRDLHRREEELRRQIANISHDLRTPLTSILGYLQLLEGEGLSPQDTVEYLEVVHTRARVLQGLVSAFYDLSRIDSGEYPLDKQPVDLHRLLSELLASYYGDLESSGLQVEVALQEGLPPVRADLAAAERILTNLLGNAMKHGCGTLRISLSAQAGCQTTAFSNAAPDLTQEDLPRVFDRFYTADQMRTGQNTGLGLAIVKALAEKMGHQVFARLEDGIFTVGVIWNSALKGGDSFHERKPI